MGALLALVPEVQPKRLRDDVHDPRVEVEHQQMLGLKTTLERHQTAGGRRPEGSWVTPLTLVPGKVTDRLQLPQIERWQLGKRDDHVLVAYRDRDHRLGSHHPAGGTFERSIRRETELMVRARSMTFR